MKAKSRITISLAPLLAACTVLPLVLYVFTRNHIYNMILAALDLVFPNFDTYQTPILAVLFVGLLILFIFGSEKAMSGTYIFLWVLLLPSILWFSNLDWFRITGLPFNLEVFAANLPFIEVLVAGVVLVTTRIFFSFMSQIKNTRLELLGRGALGPDAQRAVSKQSTFFSALVLGCLGAAFLIIAATSTVKTALQGWLPAFPFSYVFLGLAGASALIICTALYLRSQADIRKAQST